MPSTSKPTPPVMLTNLREAWSRGCSFGDCSPMNHSRSDLSELFSVGFDARSWTRTPGFRALKKQGKRLPENPFSRTSVSASASASVRSETVSSWADEVGNSTFSRNVRVMSLRYLYSNPISVDFDVLTDSEVAIKLLDKIKDAEWQAPVFVAEARKSMEMVLQSAKTLARTIRNLRKGRIADVFKDLGLTENKRIIKRYNTTRFKDPSKAAAEAWLQLKYGWIPLLLDAKSAAETLAEIVEKDRDLPLTARVSMRRTTETVQEVAFSGQPVGSGSVRLETKTEVSKRLLVSYRVNPLDVPGSLGLLNPLAVAWELVPLSFVADWFLPIGDYLQHLDANLRYTFLSGLKSGSGMSQGSASLGSSSSGATQVGSKDRFTVRQTFAEPLGSLPTPSVRDIRFSPKLGVSRLVSGIALLRVDALRLNKLRY